MRELYIVWGLIVCFILFSSNHSHSVLLGSLFEGGGFLNSGGYYSTGGYSRGWGGSSGGFHK